MSGAVVISQLGGPEVLEWVEKDPGEVGPDEVRVRHTAVGLNFIDVYHRTGLYPQELPFTPGVEGAGIVEAVGSEVDDLEVGARVAYTSNGPIGSYCEVRVIPRWRLVELPDEISEETAASMMVKGCTVEYLVRRTYAVQSGDNVLLTAAAGGVGLIACQWLSALGANVIGTVGTPEKGELAKANGCDHVILYDEEDVAERVAEITDGQGCRVAYDSVGASTFESSLKSLSPRGLLVTFGNASGPVEPMSPLLLAKHHSLFLTRPRLADHYSDPRETAEGIGALFDMVRAGKVRPHVGERYPLSDVASAHKALEARQTVGSTVLLV